MKDEGGGFGGIGPVIVAFEINAAGIDFSGVFKFLGEILDVSGKFI